MYIFIIYIIYMYIYIYMYICREREIERERYPSHPLLGLAEPPPQPRVDLVEGVGLRVSNFGLRVSG